MTEETEMTKNDNNTSSIHVRDLYGRLYETGDKISEGGQGAVYLTNDPYIAVKFAFDSSENRQIMTVNNISREIIKEKNREFLKLLLLPLPKNTNITLPVSALKDAVGYTMRLVEDMASFEKTFAVSFSKESVTSYTNEKITELFGQYPDIEARLLDYAGTGGARRRLNAYYLCSCILSRLHAQGLVYCDFSDNNVFISKNEGDLENDNVWLIDADNLNFQEVTLNGGYYTPMYGAPEVVKGRGCSLYSDCYAFSVSFFQSMILTHPFKGMAYFDYDGSAEDADSALETGELAYVLDSNDDSNELLTPDSDYLTQFTLDDNIRPLFSRTFIEGKIDLRKRPSMMEWADGISRALDAQLVCSVCKLPYINNDDVCVCSWCDNINNVLIIRSYTVNNRQIREFCREFIDGDTIKVPLRLLKGTDALRPKEELLNIRVNDNTAAIVISNDEYLLYIAETGQRIFGAYEISIGGSDAGSADRVRRTVTLLAEDISDNIKYKLEVEIIC